MRRALAPTVLALLVALVWNTGAAEAKRPVTTTTTTSVAPTTTTTVPPASPRRWFGVLQVDGSHLSSDRNAGVTTVTLEVGWDSYEPSPGAYNTTYVQSVKNRLASYRAAGFSVVLDPGLQYPPAWVFSLDSATRFVNQYGDVWHGNLGEDVANAVFDPSVRSAQARYLARLGADLGGQPLAAVRAGGLLDSELRYPQPAYNGHTNSYWAFDSAAQAASPVPGWRPGTPDPTSASAFLHWYLDSLTGYQNWLLATLRQSFAVPLQVLYPSWGIRPGEVDAAISASLNGTSLGEKRQTVNMGLDWDAQVGALAGTNAVAYTTWLDAADQGTTPSYQSPVRYLASLAAPLGVPVAGENTGHNDATSMQRCFDYALQLNLTGVMWMSDPDLWSGAYATLSDYSRLIASA